MKGNDIRSLHTKTQEELKTLASKLQGEVAKMIVSRTSNKDKNVHALKEKKKDIARILTILKEREVVHA
jgi:ribosomal protein L29